MRRQEEVREALAGLDQAFAQLADETTGEVRAKVAGFSQQASVLADELAAGTMSLEVAQEATDNLSLATRSALVNAGYAAQQRTFEALLLGLGTAFRLIAALA